MIKINKVAVIGSGVMGRGIAAQIANSRTMTLLLDIEDTENENPSRLAVEAKNNLLVSKPDPLSHPDMIKYIECGNLRDDLEKLSECDLIIEVIVEKIELKHSLYSKILPHLKSGAIISSNTSTLPLFRLKEKLSRERKDRFVITHFFNPPRYMELLELVIDQDVQEDVVSTIRGFLSNILGKQVIECNDTPGFIANRIGCYLLELATRQAIDLKLDINYVDNIFRKLLGFPSTGIFGLYDLIGHDVMKYISSSLKSTLPSDDDYHKVSQENELLQILATRGMVGRKAGGGFYKLEKDSGKSIKKVLNLRTMEYEILQKIEPPQTIEDLLKQNNDYSNFIETVLHKFYQYVVHLVPEVTNNPTDIERALKLGYSLKYGPFELMSKMPKSFLPKFSDKLIDQVQEGSEGFSMDSFEAGKIKLENNSAKLYNYQNMLILEFTTKLGILNSEIFELILESVKLAESTKNRLIIVGAYRQGHFSAGADLKSFYKFIVEKDYRSLEEFLELGQKAMMSLKNSKTEIVSAAMGVALGGGCELLLHSDFVIGHQNLQAGLVEMSVGFIPAWGGFKEMILNSKGNKKILKKNVMNIINHYKSSSCEHARENLINNIQACMNQKNLIDDAMNIKITNQEKLSKIKSIKINLLDELASNNLDDSQKEVVNSLQNLLDQGGLGEKKLLEFERDLFLKLSTKENSLIMLSKFI